MYPGINPKQMQAMMKRMGIQQQQIPANEVVIRGDEEIIKITNPSVTKVKMMGQDTFQITGTITKEAIGTVPDINQGDIKTVVDQTGVTEEQAKDSLEKNEGDIAKTILELKQ